MCSYYPQVASNRPTAGFTSNRKFNHFKREHISYLDNFDLKEDYFPTSPSILIQQEKMRTGCLEGNSVWIPTVYSDAYSGSEILPALKAAQWAPWPTPSLSSISGPSQTRSFAFSVHPLSVANQQSASNGNACLETRVDVPNTIFPSTCLIFYVIRFMQHDLFFSLIKLIMYAFLEISLLITGRK